jgi:hypothetical protein
MGPRPKIKKENTEQPNCKGANRQPNCKCYSKNYFTHAPLRHGYVFHAGLTNDCSTKMKILGDNLVLVLGWFLRLMRNRRIFVSEERLAGSQWELIHIKVSVNRSLRAS